MSRIEELTAVRAAPPQAMRALLEPARHAAWVAPNVRLVSRTAVTTLGPGDRLRLDVLGGPSFDYLVEAVSDREVVFAFTGPWRGRERWSFIPDGAETVVRRVYEVDGAVGLAALAWETVGRALMGLGLRLELARFREAVERDPGPRAEIEPPERPAAAPLPEPAAPSPPFPVDDD